MASIPFLSPYTSVFLYYTYPPFCFVSFFKLKKTPCPQVPSHPYVNFHKLNFFLSIPIISSFMAQEPRVRIPYKAGLFVCDFHHCLSYYQRWNSALPGRAFYHDYSYTGNCPLSTIYTMFRELVLLRSSLGMLTAGELHHIGNSQLCTNTFKSN